MTDDKDLIERLRNLARQQAGNNDDEASYSGGRRLTAEDAVYWIAASRISSLLEEVERLREAAGDMLSGWRYIRSTHGDLPGVGWDRAESKVTAALSPQPQSDTEK